MNRLGDNHQMQQLVDARGREVTARLLGRLLRYDFHIEIGAVSPDGDVTVRIPFADLRCRQADILLIPYLHSPFFSDVPAGFAIRRKQDRFNDLLAQLGPDFYRDAVKRYMHRACGLWIEPMALRLQFHLSLLHMTLNEELAELTRTAEK